MRAQKIKCEENRTGREKLNFLPVKITLGIIAILFFTLACSGDDGGNDVPPTTDQGIGEVDQALVGIWIGEVSGSFGNADMTMELKSDGTISAEGSTGLYCKINGKWGVKDNVFRIKGNDVCDGTAVTFNATRSVARLSGSWNAASGNNGAFSVTRQ